MSVNAIATVIATRPATRILPAARRATEPPRPRSLLSAPALLALLFVSSSSAFAYSDEAARQFRSGNTAFQAGDFTKALAAFETALAQGMTTPALHFNIGVAAYRVGDYARAETAFKEVTQWPAMSALAYYNLGLVELRRNNPEAAKQWFLRVEAATSDPKLRALASTQLGELRPPSPERSWFGYAAFGLGHDDNVALVSDSEVLGISDSADNFAELQLALSTSLGESWRLDGGAMLVDYQDLDQFDQIGAQGGARYRWLLGDWTSDAGVQLSYTTLDGSGFESRRALLVQASRDLRPDLYVRGRYRLSDIDGLNEFRGLTGQRHELSTTLDWTRAAWDLRFEYRFEVGNYDDPSLSALRHQLRFDVERNLAPDWTVLLETSIRRSNYDSDSNGNERRTDLGLALTRTLNWRWRAVLRYAYTNNDADLSEFDYTGNRISAGVEASL